MKKLLVISLILSATAGFSCANNNEDIGPRGKNVKHENKSNPNFTGTPTDKSNTGPTNKNVKHENNTDQNATPKYDKNKIGPRSKNGNF
jgi:hypothetical protein